jgi:hypothetical protein
LIEPSCVRTTAFAAIQDDASIVEWGIPDPEDKKAPTDSGYTKIYSNEYAFAAAKALSVE